MNRGLSCLLGLGLMLGGAAQAQLTLPADLPTTVVQMLTTTDRFMGEYEGTYEITGHEAATAKACVVPEKGGSYRVWIDITPGESNLNPMSLEIMGQETGDQVVLADTVGGVEWKGTVTGDAIAIEAVKGYGTKLALKKTERVSPTLGAEPPEGAEVLLAYKEGTAPNLDRWTNKKWVALSDGSMLVVPGSGSSKTIDKFGSCRLHVEFCVPYMREYTEQGRGNSGVIINELYEVQLLDSFGRILRGGDCGSVYGVAVPRVNASLPPLSWQTYDITFVAPRMSGVNLERPAKLTVELNGELIHDEQTVTGGTGLPKIINAATGPLHLQDHGNPMRFRNIWLVKLDE